MGPRDDVGEGAPGELLARGLWRRTNAVAFGPRDPRHSSSRDRRLQMMRCDLERDLDLMTAGGGQRSPPAGHTPRLVTPASPPSRSVLLHPVTSLQLGPVL